MNKTTVSKATLGRLPLYIQYLQSITDTNTSATNIAKALQLGEVQVRKDLNSVSGAGKPRVGYEVLELINRLQNVLSICNPVDAVIVGAGKLGKALLDFNELKNYGVKISAAFDINSEKCKKTSSGKKILLIDEFKNYCTDNNIRIGIITVPQGAAQNVCDMMVNCGIIGILNFAPINLIVPQNVVIEQENLALSLAYLKMKI